MKYFIAALLVAICFVSPRCANAENIFVSATTSDGVLTNPLQSGVTYVFTASGTYQFNLPASNTADAEFNFNPGLQEYFSWDGNNWGETNDILDLLINDHSINWLGATDGVFWSPHTYSSSHVYKCYFIGNGEPVLPRIADQIPFGPDYTSNNAGSLSVQIESVPEPSSILALLCGVSALGGMAWRKKI